MKKIFILALFAIAQMPSHALDTPIMNDKTADAIHAKISQAFAGLSDAVIKIDLDSYVSYFDKDKYTGLNEDGTVLHSFKAFENTSLPALQYIERYNDLTFSNVKIDVIDENTAILVNEYTAEVVLTSGDVVTAAGAGTQVWSKRTGEWKLVNVSSSAKP